MAPAPQCASDSSGALLLRLARRPENGVDGRPVGIDDDPVSVSARVVVAAPSDRDTAPRGWEGVRRLVASGVSAVHPAMAAVDGKAAGPSGHFQGEGQVSYAAP